MMLLSKNKWFLMMGCLWLVTGCISHSEKDNKATPEKKKSAVTEKNAVASSKKVQKKVPVICYHAIRTTAKSDSANKRTYSVAPEVFAQQMKALSDAGYTTISPDALYNYLVYHKSLPKKPILITFDDGRKEQYTIGSKEMKKYHFKGVFFIMTVATGKKEYMTKDELKSLFDDGHTIVCHTWDHQRVNQFGPEDWQLQLVKPKKTLENITQKPIVYFAYPYGVWNEPTADSLKKDGYKMAFIVYGKNDPRKPLYTIQRMIVPGSFSASDLLKGINKTFGKG